MAAGIFTPCLLAAQVLLALTLTVRHAAQAIECEREFQLV
jgi:hypothetical protein